MDRARSSRVARPGYFCCALASSWLSARIWQSDVRLSARILLACACWASVPAAATCEAAIARWPVRVRIWIARPGPAAGHVPRGAQLVGAGGCVLAAGAGEHVAAVARLAGLCLDEALVLELPRRRVDRAGARAPDSAAALADFTDDLVAVHRLPGQQGERRGPDVTAPCAQAAHPRAACPWAGAAEAGRPAGETAAAMAAAPAFVLAAVPVLVAGTLAAGQFCIVAVVPPGFLVSHDKFS